MEILAGLIELDDLNSLPVPWYNRPAIGLISGTRVNVAAVTSTAKPQGYPPDIIVTPLKIINLHCTSSIVVDLPEGLGGINKALKQVGERFNIALMETVTIDQRSKHRITLVLEPPSIGSDATSYAANLASLVKELTELGGKPAPQPYRLANESIEFPKRQPSKVYDGHVEIEEVRSWIEKNYGDLRDRFDFDKVVVSSNTEARFLRYIFPRTGAFEVHIPHDDIPTAMQHLTSTLTDLSYNVLLSRISKSESPDPRRHQPSVTVAICEPVGSGREKPRISTDATEISEKISESLHADAEASKYMFSVPAELISFGRKASSIQSTRMPRLVRRTIDVPTEIATYLKPYNREKRRVIFVSYPDKGREPGTKTRELVQRVFALIESMGHACYDGYGAPTAPKNGRMDDVLARMWRADAGVFIAPADGGKPPWLTPNQQIEWGFMAPLCQNTHIICHRRAQAERQFMMPDTVRLEYEKLSDGDLSLIENRMRQKILEWFPEAARQY